MKQLLLREPLVPFVLIGTALAFSWSALRPADAEGTVRIEETTLRAIEARQSELLGRPLDDREREELWQEYIDDEVLLHEALRRGLQWGDARVRKRLVQVLRGSLAEAVPDPSAAQLRAVFDADPARFATPVTVTLELVEFPWGSSAPSAGGDTRVATTLSKLRSGTPISMAISRRHKLTRADLVVTLGPGLADAVEKMPVGEWKGPIEAPAGRILCRVTKRHAPEPADFDRVEPYLRQELVVERTRAAQQERVMKIRRGYRIEVVRN